MLAIVKCGVYILQNMCCLSPHSSENQSCWAVNLPLNADLQVSSLVHFRAFRRYLVSFYLSIWFSTRVFPDAKNWFLTPKIPLFNRSFALLGHVFNGSKRLCLYHYNVFLCFFISHLAAFCVAFSTKIPCVLHQNALHLASKRTAFSTKTRCV